MTAKEALALLKMQLKPTEQNKEAIKVLEDIINLHKIHIDDEPTYTLDHLFGSVNNDLDNLCIRYKNIEEEE